MTIKTIVATETTGYASSVTYRLRGNGIWLEIKVVGDGPGMYIDIERPERVRFTDAEALELADYLANDDYGKLFKMVVDRIDDVHFANERNFQWAMAGMRAASSN